MARTYRAYNGADPTTAQMAAVASGTAIKTLLQIAPPATSQLAVVAWGISFDGTPTGRTNDVPIKCELIETDVAATVTAHVAAGIMKMSDANGIASNVGLTTTTTGYTATIEGTTTVSRLLDYQQVPPTAPYIYQWPLGNYPMVAASKFLRVRIVATTSTVNVTTWVEWSEGS